MWNEASRSKLKHSSGISLQKLKKTINTSMRKTASRPRFEPGIYHIRSWRVIYSIATSSDIGIIIVHKFCNSSNKIPIAKNQVAKMKTVNETEIRENRRHSLQTPFVIANVFTSLYSKWLLPGNECCEWAWGR